MQQHVKLVHLRKFDKICDVCGKSIRGREALARHMEEHTGAPQKVIKCHLCESTLTTKYGLARHIKMMHTAENLQPMQCEYCLKVSPSLQAHQHHIKYSHNTARSHQCPMCEKAFKRPNELRVSCNPHCLCISLCKYALIYFLAGTHDYAHGRGVVHMPALPEDFQLECKYARTSQEDALQGVARIPASASGKTSQHGHDNRCERAQDNGTNYGCSRGSSSSSGPDKLSTGMLIRVYHDKLCTIL